MIRRNAAKINYALLPSTSSALLMEDLLVLDDNFNLEPCQRLEGKGSKLVDIGPASPIRQKFFLMLFCKSGRVQLKINLQDYELKGNDVLLCYPGSIVDSIAISGDAKVGLIAFANDKFFSNADADSSLQVLRRSLLSPSLLHLDEKRYSMLNTAYGMMRSFVSSDMFQYKKDGIHGALLVIASMLAQWIDQQNPETVQAVKSRDETLFVNFLSEVRDNCTRERKISYYADKFCISPKYFAKLIFNVSGRHASDWIRDYVIMEAKSMLRSGTYTVQQVSDAMGFPNSSFFGKYFKGSVGMSPRKYMIENA